MVAEQAVNHLYSKLTIKIPRMMKVTAEISDRTLTSRKDQQLTYSKLLLIAAILAAVAMFLVTLFTLTAPSAAATAAPSGPIITLEFEAIDYDNKNEVTLVMNGKTVALLPEDERPQNNGSTTLQYLDVTSFLVEGVNTLTFLQNVGSSSIRDLSLNMPSGAGFFGNQDTVCLSQPNYPSKTFTFYFSEKPFTDYYVEYEIAGLNNRDEVTISINGQIVKNYPECGSGGTNGFWTWDDYLITPFLVNGTNTLTFTDNTGSAKIKNLIVGKYILDIPNSRLLLEHLVLFRDQEELSISNTDNRSTTYSFNLP